MSTTKEINKTAQSIAKYWFEKREERATPALFSRTIAQAKKLIECGYSEREIVNAIDYINDNPPPKGLSSLGYLNYVINDILEKLKYETIKKDIKVSSGLLKKELNNVIDNSISEFQDRFF